MVKMGIPTSSMVPDYRVNTLTENIMYISGHSEQTGVITMQKM